MVTSMAHQLVQTFILLVYSSGIVIVVGEEPLTSITKEYKRTGSTLFAGEEDVVVPYQVNEQGQLITFDIGRNARRHRRGDSGPEEIVTRCYKLVAFKEDFHLCVVPNVDLVSPDFVVKTIQRNGKIRMGQPRLDCYWTGVLESHPNSSVAISTCDGMAGLFRTTDTELLIEPLATELRKKANMSRGIPHLVKRRPLGSPGSPKDGSSPSDIHCSVKGTRTHSHFSQKSQSRHTRDSHPIVADPYVEVMVVVDHHVYKSYGSRPQQTEALVLTLMNIVSMLFSEEPNGVGVKIMVVELKILKDAGSGLNVNKDIDVALNEFCQWQRGHYVAAGHPGHYDLALLLTAINLCYWVDGTCKYGAAGKANTGDVCHPNNSCTIVEEMGFSTPFTVAHEIGHMLTMEHDGYPYHPIAKNCSSEDGFLMSRRIPNGPSTFLWSDCSRWFLQDFLRKPGARCLADKPRKAKQLSLPGVEPGHTYGADRQCLTTVADTTRACSWETDSEGMDRLSLPSNWTLCSFLVCYTKNRGCVNTSSSAADFTPCIAGSDSKVCLRGHCVNKPGPRDGGWTPYIPQGNCPRSCGGGVLLEIRSCENPKPRFGGRSCSGSNDRLKLCNEQPCPGGKHPHAAECDFLQGFVGENSNYCKVGGKRAVNSQWIPYISDVPGKECDLICQMKEIKTCIYEVGAKVPNGALCTNNGSYRCVNGNCKAVGCDGIIGSNKVIDRCNICGGDNSTCKEVTKIFNDTLDRKGYFLVKKFDVGHFRIHVEELSASDATSLSLLDSDGDYLLDSHTANKDWPEWDYNGTLIIYRRAAGQPEVITITEPLTTPLQLRVHYSPEHGPNPGIRYTFTRNKTRAVDNFFWSLSPEWSDCSVTCGRGIKLREYLCYRKHHRRIPAKEKFCDHKPKPMAQAMSCRMPDCPTRKWLQAAWSLCSDNCQWKSRNVDCYEYVDDKATRQVDDSYCTGPKPPTKKSCGPADCSINGCQDTTNACRLLAGLVTFAQLCSTSSAMNSSCCVSCRSVISSG